MIHLLRSKDGVVLSVNEEISGDRQKYQIQNQYDLLIKKVDENDTGRYLCQNFDQVLSINVLLTVLSKFIDLLIDTRKLFIPWKCADETTTDGYFMPSSVTVKQ